MDRIARKGRLHRWGEQETPPLYRIATHATAPGEYIVELEGEFDLAAYPALGEELDDLAERDASRVVADLGAVTFLDVATLGLLEAAHIRLRAQGSELRVVCSDSQIWRLLRLTDLDRVLDIFATLPLALSAPRYPARVIPLRPAYEG